MNAITVNHILVYTGTMKLYSWNVNGIRAILNKGALQAFVAVHNPDILCLQETKAERGQVEIDLPQYNEHFYSAVKKGYSGTAIFSKTKPIRYVDGLPNEIIQTYQVPGDTYGDPNKEGRIIAAEFDDFWVVTCYTPNSKGDLSRLALRYDHWDKAVLAYLKMLEDGSLPDDINKTSEQAHLDASQGNSEHGDEAVHTDTVSQRTELLTQRGAKSSRSAKAVLYCGDMNVAYQEIDLANPKPNIGKHGFTNEERERFGDYLEAGFVDTYRAANPHKTGAYTWWTHWANARSRNVGWRIDYWLASQAIASKIKNPAIHPDILGSDHCPVSIEL